MYMYKMNVHVHCYIKIPFLIGNQGIGIPSFQVHVHVHGVCTCVVPCHSWTLPFPGHIRSQIPVGLSLLPAAPSCISLALSQWWLTSEPVALCRDHLTLCRLLPQHPVCVVNRIIIILRK